MQTLRFIIAIIALILGFPIGNFLARKTHEELKAGQPWFKLIIIVCFIGAIISLILGNDALLFSFLFIAVVTSRSLLSHKKRKKNL